MKKRAEAERREREEKKRKEELEREIERMQRQRGEESKQKAEGKREEEKKQHLSIIRNVSETVVKIPNRETIQEGNRFHNKSDKCETIIIGNKMSRV